MSAGTLEAARPTDTADDAVASVMENVYTAAREALATLFPGDEFGIRVAAERDHSSEMEFKIWVHHDDLRRSTTHGCCLGRGESFSDAFEKLVEKTLDAMAKARADSVLLAGDRALLVNQAALAFPGETLADSVAAAIEAGLRARQAEVEKGGIAG